jgi:antitoxin component YwqK of YwqJK toxin-antitoxin module
MRGADFRKFGPFFVKIGNPVIMSKAIVISWAVFFVSLQPAGAETITRKTDVVRGADHYQSVFYRGGQQIASQKHTQKDGVFEESGETINGRVKFENDYRHTYGEEYYRKGKVNGEAMTYYEDGQLKKESFFLMGKLIRSREYYSNGNLRFEVDYDGALTTMSSDEIGVGKLYYLDGKMKYQWDFRFGNKRNFRKCYDRDGKPTFEAYYDESGARIP